MIAVEKRLEKIHKQLERQIPWVNIRMDYVDGWPKMTFTALAEQHGVSRGTIAKAAKRERWAYHARLIHAEKRLRKAEEDLAFVRRQAADVAAVLVRLSKAKGTATRELERDSAEAYEAHLAAHNIRTAASMYAYAVRSLREAKAGTAGPSGDGLRDLQVSEYGGPGRWPMCANDPPRKPFPWEKRRATA